MSKDTSVFLVSTYQQSRRFRDNLVPRVLWIFDQRMGASRDWRPSADQKARGLWVRDCFRDERSECILSESFNVMLSSAAVLLQMQCILQLYIQHKQQAAFLHSLVIKENATFKRRAHLRLRTLPAQWKTS